MLVTRKQMNSSERRINFDKMRATASSWMGPEAKSINNFLLTLRNCFEAMRHNKTARQTKID